MTTPIPPSANVDAASLLKSIPGLIPGADQAQAALDGIIASRRWISDRHNWVRVGWTLAGLALMAIGAVAVARPAATRAAREAASLARTVKGA